MYQPGEHWLYNIGYDVLGVLIARASGQSLAEFMQQRIFGPLGMKDTGFSVPADKHDRLASAYFPNSETGELELFDDATNSSWSTLPAFQAGASGLVSTVDDYLAFAQMMLNQGKLGDTRILSRPSVEVMTTDQLTPEQKAQSNELDASYWESHGWGFGVSIVTRRDSGPDSPGKYGWDGGFGTSYRGDPAEEMITILLTQAAFTSASGPAIAFDFSTAAYAAIDD
jgi:CubicO group peptidase (beta-lactamase class C family)